jgi:aldehyde dehydrogenase (NAD+)
MNKNEINNLVIKQKDFYLSGKTKDYHFRIGKLKMLKALVQECEQEINKALLLDLGKGAFESFVGEIGLFYTEIDHAIIKLKKWMKPQKTKTPLASFPGTSSILPEPYGTVLIIGPWNYPFSLIFLPLIGAICAGNTIIIKPSEISVHTSKIIIKLLRSAFNSSFIAVVPGGVKETTLLLEQQFDYIFFTGSVPVGRIIMEKAAPNLTPVTLELGGKSPTVVFGNIDLKMAAKRIVWGKFFNAGQTCIAPDYIIVEERHKQELVERMGIFITEFFSNKPDKSNDFGKIINTNHFKRLLKLLEKDMILAGGDYDLKSLYISPTIMDSYPDAPIMEDEIFGPLLPLITINNIDGIIDFINSRPKPLVLYVFSADKDVQNKIITRTSSGGVCINDTLVHASNSNLPFGGVGESGIGRYHGRYSFETFSHRKSILKRSKYLDLPLRYPPYKNKLSLIKKLFPFSIPSPLSSHFLYMNSS